MRSTSTSRRVLNRSASISCLLISLLMALSPVQVNADDGHNQRVLFLETKKALEEGNYKIFGQNIQQLKDYPLYPYLIYWKLKGQINEQPSATIEAFLINYKHLPITPLLRSAWLKQLAKEERWEEFLRFYRGGGTQMRCLLHIAQLHTGNKRKAWAGAKKLWLVGHSQPEACDTLFKAWEEAGKLTRDLRWQRIELSMENGRSGLARYLAKGLNDKDRQHITLWRRIDNDPSLIERSQQIKGDNRENRRIIIHGLKRLAKRDTEQAISLWRKVQSSYRFDDKQRQAIDKAIALNFAYDGDVRGLIWLAQLPDKALNTTERTWAVRLALRHKNWKAALTWIDTMPVKQRQSVRWQYWQARIQDALGEKQQAEHLFYTVSQDRSYYGFLAADHINTRYNLEHKPVEVNEEELATLKQTPQMVRAHELYMLLLTKDARREWESAVARMDSQQRLVAGKLADEWKWYDRALLTLAKANYFSDLDIRFPLAHNDTIHREAQNRQIDPAWVYAVARQESAMSPDARSPAGALGLMQLMPSTGKAVAKKLNYPIENSTQLLEPDTNIRLGAYYLRQVLDRFNNHPVLATAAYNAGPNRIKKWFPERGKLDADIWVESMPFHETRQYVRRVMAYTVFYDQRLDDHLTRLNQRMPPIEIVNDKAPL